MAERSFCGAMFQRESHEGEGSGYTPARYPTSPCSSDHYRACCKAMAVPLPDTRPACSCDAPGAVVGLAFFPRHLALAGEAGWSACRAIILRRREKYALGWRQWQQVGLPRMPQRVAVHTLLFSRSKEAPSTDTCGAHGQSQRLAQRSTGRAPHSTVGYIMGWESNARSLASPCLCGRGVRWYCFSGSLGQRQGEVDFALQNTEALCYDAYR
ncbi:hypothetical protein FB567DRAFT_582873 [Paraphoma chrysanthemicola]|uniref:Uncharacterized protein n=1 Tax=Paraphoma chrysanthemicola TaxID=798071 RepID=A0A8K0QX93_9PLEO|nr:hypothetical protein FB567DRAFT_582873 [Paraphoma chrysanthemicola]